MDVFSAPTLLSVSCAKVDTTLILLPISVFPVLLLSRVVLSVDLTVSVIIVLVATF